MKRVISVLLIAFVVSNVTMAEETAFSRVKLADAKGKPADARLIFSDNNKNLVVRVADPRLCDRPLRPDRQVLL